MGQVEKTVAGQRDGSDIFEAARTIWKTRLMSVRIATMLKAEAISRVGP